MSAVHQFINVVTDVVTGKQVGMLFNAPYVTREVITGSSVGYAGPMGALSITRDVVTGQYPGALFKAPYVINEVITGNGVGFHGPLRTHSIVKEIICRDSSYRFAMRHNEVVGQMLNEILVIQRTTRTLQQQVARTMSRTAPPNVWSITFVPTLREVVGQRNVRPAPHSIDTVYTVRHQTGQRRVSAPPEQVSSMLQMPTVRQIVGMSRHIPYNPVSGNFTYTERMQVAQDRSNVPLPTNVRSPLYAPAVVELIALSKRASYQLRVPQVFQLVARLKIITFSAPTSVATDVQQVAQQRAFPASQQSPMYSLTDTQQVAQQRITPGILRSSITFFTFSGLVAQHRDTAGILHSITKVSTDVQQVAQHRDTSDPSDAFGPVAVAGEVQQIAQQFTPAPVPHSSELAQTVSLLAAQHKEVLAPNATSDWKVIAQQCQVAQAFDYGGALRSPMYVATQRVQYALGANYPDPADVLGPEVGAQIRQEWQLAAQFRVTDSPHTYVKESRFVFNLAQRPVVTDVFPDKNLGYTPADVWSVAEQVAVVDDFGDPYVAFSNVDAFSVLSPVVLPDEPWPDPAVPLSEAQVSAIHVGVILSEEMPDPTIPASDAQVWSAAQFAAVGDDSFSDPTQPLSDVQTHLLGAFPVVADVFANPMMPMSPADIFILAEMVVLRDTTMNHIPARPDRRRPVVTVSIS